MEKNLLIEMTTLLLTMLIAIPIAQAMDVTDTPITRMIEARDIHGAGTAAEHTEAQPITRARENDAIAGTVVAKHVADEKTKPDDLADYVIVEHDAGIPTLTDTPLHFVTITGLAATVLIANPLELRDLARRRSFMSWLLGAVARRS